MEKQITAVNFINLIKEKFPKFIAYWESYISEWGLDEGLTIQMLPFSDYAIDVIKSNDENEIKRVFDFVEFLLCNGDESVTYAITTSFLEYLLSHDPDEIQFSKFSRYLGENTVNYCKAWDKFTGIKTEGLWDNEKEE